MRAGNTQHIGTVALDLVRELDGETCAVEQPGIGLESLPCVGVQLRHGNVVVQWSILEKTVDIAIAKQTKLSGDAPHVSMTVGVGFPFRLDMLGGIGEIIRQRRRREELITIVSDIRQIMPERNFVVHAAWLGDDPTMQATCSSVTRLRSELKSGTRNGSRP